MDLTTRFRRVRAFTDALVEPLCTEDMVVQTMPDVSPTKWHMAHTTWFFETFILARRPDHRRFHPQYEVLFNSYYNAVGPQFPRPRRGLLSRPTVADVRAYRAHVDAAMDRLLEAGDLDDELAATLEIGLHHEQQHQELLLTDIKHVLGTNPLFPAYRDAEASGDAPDTSHAPAWLDVPGGLHEIGHRGDGFAFDNETPRHRVFFEDCQLASRPVTNGEFLAFMADGGYQTPSLWLSEGWAAVQAETWRAPLYWVQRDGQWHHYSLYGGLVPVDEAAPVCHVSLYEAEAFAHWAGAELPTEQQWEVAADHHGVDPARVEHANCADQGRLHPTAAPGEASADVTPQQMIGDVWEWTRSAYSAYPGYAPLEGALGEYNGKFMCAQTVLRGGSCATSRDHLRTTYRNFFPAGARWQFSGLRLLRR